MTGPEIGEAILIVPVSFWAGLWYGKTVAIYRMIRGNRRSIRNTIRGGR